jgi:hypothetical protein
MAYKLDEIARPERTEKVWRECISEGLPAAPSTTSEPWLIAQVAMMSTATWSSTSRSEVATLGS